MVVVLSSRPWAAGRRELELPGGMSPIPILLSNGVQRQFGCKSTEAVGLFVCPSYPCAAGASSKVLFPISHLGTDKPSLGEVSPGNYFYLTMLISHFPFCKVQGL